MGITHLQGLEIAGVPTMGMNGLPGTTGNVYFVNSVTGSNGNPGTADFPYATIMGAYAACLANNGDTIVCTAGHAETVSTAGGITIANAGITIVGWGEGNDRPVLTFSTSTAATVVLSGNNTYFSNFVGVCNINNLVSPFVVSGANCTLGIEWHDTSASVGALRAVLTTAAASNLTVNLTYLGFTAGTQNVNAIRLVGCVNGFINVDYYGTVSTAIVEFFTTACTNIQVNGYFYTSGTTNFSKDVVDTVGGSTWSIQGYDGAAGQPVSGGSAGTPAAPTVSLTAITNQQEFGALSSNTGVMVTAALIFTVSGGPVMITGLCSICTTANGATASTLQYEAISTLGTLTGTISGASASLASAVAGTVVTLIGTALSTAPVISATGVGLMTITPIVVQAGTINIVIGAGSTTGTWSHYIRYKPLVAGAKVA